jgi:hypothetical protein
MHDAGYSAWNPPFLSASIGFLAKKLPEITLNGATILRLENSDFLRELSPQAILISRAYRLRETENFMHAAQAHPRRGPRLSPDLAAALHPAKDAAAQLKRRVSRLEIYDLLEAIYGIYVDWKRRNIAKRSAHTLADELNMVRRKGTSPIRVLIDAVKPDADFKQKSRWVRALEYLYSQDVPVERFRKFAERHGGVAGCARLAVQVNRKRRRPRRNCIEGDWDD